MERLALIHRRCLQRENTVKRMGIGKLTVQKEKAAPLDPTVAAPQQIGGDRIESLIRNAENDVLRVKKESKKRSRLARRERRIAPRRLVCESSDERTVKVMLL